MGFGIKRHPHRRRRHSNPTGDLTDRYATNLFGQALDGRDLGTIMHHRKREAAVDALPVDDDRAGAALPLVAALL